MSKWSLCKTQQPSVAGLFFRYLKEMGYSSRLVCWKEKWGKGEVSMLWVDSWTDGRQSSMRSQICLQNCHIPDQTLNFLSVLTPLLRAKRASVIGLPCAYFSGRVGFSWDWGSEVGQTYRRDRASRNTVVVLSVSVFIFIFPPCWLEFILNDQSWCVRA